jgi:tetratricopeptide (TPR) repeat protein
MKFDKLFKIITEAKGTKPGERFFNARESDPTRTISAGGRKSVSPISSSPVGKADNMEVRQPLSRWEFNPTEDMDKGGVRKQAKAWRTLYNSFSLLSNDKNFQEEVKAIAKNFDKRRDSYKNVIGVKDEEGKTVGYTAYDEESRVNTLPATIDKQIGKRTGYEEKISKNRTLINYTKMGPSAKFELKKTIESLRSDIKTTEDELNSSDISYKRKGKLESELKMFVKMLNTLENKLQAANVSSTESLKAEIVDCQEKIKELDKKIEKNQEELKTLTDRTTKIQSNNEEINDSAIQAFKDQVNISAKRIKNEIAESIKELQMAEDEGVEDVDNVMEIDWNNIPKTFKSKVAMLDSLESTDPSINPIFGYIDSFNNWYYEISEDGTRSRVKDLDSREFNPQLNITKIRDYNSLPFVRLMNIYSSAAIPKMSLKPDPNLKKHDNTYANFIQYIQQFPNSKDPTVIEYNRKAWVDPETKEMLRSFVAGMAIENKDTQYGMINRSWMVSRTGCNSFCMLQSSIDTDMKRFKPKEESFDKVYSHIISEKVWDEDDFKINTMELLSLASKSK